MPTAVLVSSQQTSQHASQQSSQQYKQNQQLPTDEILDCIASVKTHLQCPLCGDHLKDTFLDVGSMQRICRRCMEGSIEEGIPDLKTMKNIKEDKAFDALKSALLSIMTIIKMSKECHMRMSKRRVVHLAQKHQQQTSSLGSDDTNTSTILQKESHVPEVRIKQEPDDDDDDDVDEPPPSPDRKRKSPPVSEPTTGDTRTPPTKTMRSTENSNRTGESTEAQAHYHHHNPIPNPLSGALNDYYMPLQLPQPLTNGNAVNGRPPEALLLPARHQVEGNTSIRRVSNYDSALSGSLASRNRLNQSEVSCPLEVLSDPRVSTKPSSTSQSATQPTPQSTGNGTKSKHAQGVVDHCADQYSTEVEIKIGRWSEDEHALFLKGLEMFGKNYREVASFVKTRHVDQVRHHGDWHFAKEKKLRMEKELDQAPSNGLKSTKAKDLGQDSAKTKTPQTLKATDSQSVQGVEETPQQSEPHQHLSGSNDATSSPNVEEVSKPMAQQGATISNQAGSDQGQRKFVSKITPHPHDIVQGRGRGPCKHPGNTYLRSLAMKACVAYKNTSRRKEKQIIAESIVDHIARRDPPGRFLAINRNSDGYGLHWEIQSRYHAIEKVKQMIRDFMNNRANDCYALQDS